MIRAVVALVLALFAAMPPAAMYEFSDGNPWAALLALPAFTLFPWYPMLAGFAWFLGEALGSWRWIEIVGAGGTIRARRDAFMLWGHRHTEIAEEEIESLRLLRRGSDAGGGDGLTSLQVVHRGRKWLFFSGEKSTWLTFRRRAHERRSRFLGFAFEVARLLERPRYRLERDDHLAVEVALVPSEDDGESRPVPAVGEGPASEPADPPIPERELPPFEPGMLDSGHEVVEWDPGRIVAIRKDGLSVGRALAASVLGTLLFNAPAIAAGLLILTGDAEEVGLFWNLVVAGVVLFVTLLLNAFIWTEGRSRRTARFDWAAGRLHLTKDRREVAVPFSEVTGLEVRGFRTGERGGDSGPRYRCQVRVRTEGPAGIVAETSASPLPGVPYGAAARMAEDLADALDLEWRWRGWEERTLFDEARRLARRFWYRYVSAPDGGYPER